MRAGDGLHMVEALFYRLDEHLAHRLSRQPFAFQRPVRHDLAVAAVVRERCSDSLARFALDLEAVLAPARIAVFDCHLAFVGSAGLSTTRRFGSCKALPAITRRCASRSRAARRP